MFKQQDGAGALIVAAALLVGVPAGAGPRAGAAGAQLSTPAARPTVEEARKFVEDAEARLYDLDVRTARADWVHSTYITDDTEVLAAQANERLVAAKVELAKAATRFDGLTLGKEVARKLTLLKLAMTLSAPSDPKGVRHEQSPEFGGLVGVILPTATRRATQREPFDRRKLS